MNWLAVYQAGQDYLTAPKNVGLYSMKLTLITSTASATAYDWMSLYRVWCARDRAYTQSSCGSNKSLVRKCFFFYSIYFVVPQSRPHSSPYPAPSVAILLTFFRIRFSAINLILISTNTNTDECLTSTVWNLVWKGLFCWIRKRYTIISKMEFIRRRRTDEWRLNSRESLQCNYFCTYSICTPFSVDNWFNYLKRKKLLQRATSQKRNEELSLYRMPVVKPVTFLRRSIILRHAPTHFKQTLRWAGQNFCKTSYFIKYIFRIGSSVGGACHEGEGSGETIATVCKVWNFHFLRLI